MGENEYKKQRALALIFEMTGRYIADRIAA
jgi:hypothetical protein